MALFLKTSFIKRQENNLGIKGIDSYQWTRCLLWLWVRRLRRRPLLQLQPLPHLHPSRLHRHLRLLPHHRRRRLRRCFLQTRLKVKHLLRAEQKLTKEQAPSRHAE